MVLETFRQALQNVWSNKLRTFLTMLGISQVGKLIIQGCRASSSASWRSSSSSVWATA